MRCWHIFGHAARHVCISIAIAGSSFTSRHWAGRAKSHRVKPSAMPMQPIIDDDVHDHRKNMFPFERISTKMCWLYAQSCRRSVHICFRYYCEFGSTFKVSIDISGNRSRTLPHFHKNRMVRLNCVNATLSEYFRDRIGATEK